MYIPQGGHARNHADQRLVRSGRVHIQSTTAVLEFRISLVDILSVIKIKCIDMKYLQNIFQS